jgi:uncharacterized SAM-binding protein YcdF (DUF218 family)
MRLFRKLLILVIIIVIATFVGATINYGTIPTSNSILPQFDAIVVLGTPANPDGSPSPEQRERTLEGIREFKAGIAPHLIFTGAAAHNQFIEAHVMAMLALSQGVPPTAIIEEDHAQNTVQNIFYSRQIMSNSGWNSAEVVSSPSHLPRTALILEHYPIQWSTHAAPWPPEYSIWQRAAHYAVEAEYCLRLRIFGFQKSRFLPSETFNPH